MAKKYRVTLTGVERDELEALLACGKADVRKLKHAQVLLRADEGEAADGAGAGRAGATPGSPRRWTSGWPRFSACGSGSLRTALPRP